MISIVLNKLSYFLDCIKNFDMKNKDYAIKNYVIWIDQKKAVIGTFDENEKYSYSTLYSGIESRIRFPGEKSNKVRLITSKRTKETSEERKLDQGINQFCNKILQQLSDATSLFVIGPAETKTVLEKLISSKKEFEKTPLKIQNADKLTLAEIKTKAAKHFKIQLRKKYDPRKSAMI